MRLDDVARLPLSYREVMATVGGRLPDGYRIVRQEAVIGRAVRTGSSAGT